MLMRIWICYIAAFYGIVLTAWLAIPTSRNKTAKK